MTYAEILSESASNIDLRDSMTVAIYKAAFDVLVEYVETVNHENRLTWAKSAVRNPVSYIDQFIVKYLLDSNVAVNENQMLVNQEFSVEVGDEDIDVSSYVDIFAI